MFLRELLVQKLYLEVYRIAWSGSVSSYEQVLKTMYILTEIRKSNVRPLLNIIYSSLSLEYLPKMFKLPNNY